MLLHTWPCSFTHAAPVFLRKRKTVAQKGGSLLTKVPGICSGDRAPVQITAYPHPQVTPERPGVAGITGVGFHSLAGICPGPAGRPPTAEGPRCDSGSRWPEFRPRAHVCQTRGAQRVSSGVHLIRCGGCCVSVAPSPAPLSRRPGRPGAGDARQPGVDGMAPHPPAPDRVARVTYLGGHGAPCGPELQSDGQRGPEGGGHHGCGRLGGPLAPSRHRSRSAASGASD